MRKEGKRWRFDESQIVDQVPCSENRCCAIRSLESFMLSPVGKSTDAFVTAIAPPSIGWRMFVGFDDRALWTISVDGRVIGSLVQERGECRLSWFAGADPRLVAYAGPVDADIGPLGDRFAVRLGGRSAGDVRLAIVSATV